MWGIFKILSLFYYFFSSYAWWSFLMPRNIIVAFLGTSMALCLMFAQFNVNITKRSMHILILIFLFAIFGMYQINMSNGLLTFFSYFPAFLLFVLPRDKKLNLLNFISKWYSIILALSIVVYGLTYIVNLPSIGSFIAEDLNYPPYENYILFIKQSMYDNYVYRFNGMFLEPGHQAMISGILLFANKYDFINKKYLLIPLIAILISFSLAGYVILFIGVILLYTKSIIKLIGLGIMLLMLNLFVTELWNDGDNPVNYLIFSRLEYDDDKGITGNNRTIKQTDDYFDKCVKDGTIFLGVRNNKQDKYRIRGAGYKIYLIRYGILSALIVIGIYILLINPKCNRRYGISFFLLMTLIFLQRAYPTWYSWLLPYVLGTGIYLRNRKQILKIQTI